MLTRHGLDPRYVVLELTEREAVEDIGRLRRAAEDCRLAGIRLAADDVGSGNAGLRLLSQLKFDIVKIDLSLVQGGAVHQASLEVVRTLRDLADRWGALVVAEGIETPAQLDLVRSLGIGAGQGYLLGRPTDRPSTEALDLDTLSRSTDWLIDRLRVAADMSADPRRRQDLWSRLTHARKPARLPKRRRKSVAITRGDPIGLVRIRRSPQGRRRHHVGWPARARPHRADRSGRRIPPRNPPLDSGAWWPSWAYYRLPAGPRDTEGRAPLGSTTTDQPQDPCRDGKGLSVSSKDHTEDPFR